MGFATQGRWFGVQIWLEVGFLSLCTPHMELFWADTFVHNKRQPAFRLQSISNPMLFLL